MFGVVLDSVGKKIELLAYFVMSGSVVLVTRGGSCSSRYSVEVTEMEKWKALLSLVTNLRGKSRVYWEE